MAQFLPNQTVTNPLVCNIPAPTTTRRRRKRSGPAWSCPPTIDVAFMGDPPPQIPAGVCGLYISPVRVEDGRLHETRPGFIVYRYSKKN